MERSLRLTRLLRLLEKMLRGEISPWEARFVIFTSMSLVYADLPKMTVVAKEDVAKFYDDFYQFLSSCGVDAVKTEYEPLYLAPPFKILMKIVVPSSC